MRRHVHCYPDVAVPERVLLPTVAGNPGGDDLRQVPPTQLPLQGLQQISHLQICEEER